MRLSVVRASGEESVASIGTLPLVVGSGQAADVRVEGPGVESAHARFVGDTIEALFPCTVGEVALAAGAQRTLVPFVALRLGALLFYVDDEAYATSVPTRDLVLAGLKDSASVWPSVLVVEGPGRGTRLVLTEERSYTAGRSDQTDLQLEALSVSRVHLEIRRVGASVRICDRGATRGTFLGAHRLAAGREAIWTPHRMVRVGDSVLGLSVPGFCEAPSFVGSSDAGSAGAGGARPASAERSPPSMASPVSLIEESVPSLRLLPGGTQAGIAHVPDSDPPAAPKRSRTLGDVALRATLVALIVIAAGTLIYVLLA